MEKKFNNFLDTLDISQGDILYIASDITKILLYHKKHQIKFSPDDFLDYFINRLGPSGTLLLPAFTWEFCRGIEFDIRGVKSETGSLSKIALKRDDFKRTRHPIYSFAVNGKDQNFLIDLDDKSGWGPNSLFAYFHKNAAKNLFIGIDYKNGFTFDHYFEEKIGVDYRYFKYFEANYIDYDGSKSKKKYNMYVRDLEKNIVTSINPKLDKVLEDKKAYFKNMFEGIYFGIVDMKVAGDVMENDIKNKGGLIFAKKII